MGQRTAGREERLSAVKQAALSLFSERGYEQTTIRLIAESASVSTGTVMSFGDKATLLIGLMEDAITGLMPRSPRAGGTPVNAVWQCYKPYFDFYASKPELARPYAAILLSPAGRKHSALGEQAREFNALVAGRIATHYPRIPQSEAILTAEALFAAYIHALVSWSSETVTLSRATSSLRRQITWQLARFEG